MDEAERPRRWRRLGFRVGAVAVALVIALLCAEGVARLLFQDAELFTRLDRWVEHPVLGRVPRPNQTFSAAGAEYATNSLGLRDDERPPVPADGTFRVAVVGDSFVWGVGARETIFPRVAERLLREEGYADVEVQSIGLPGYGTLQQNAFLTERLAAFRFDLAVLAFCVGNDLTENHRFASGERAEPAGRGVAEGWLDRSRLVQVVRTARRTERKAGHERFYRFVARRMRLARPSLYDDPQWRETEAATLSAIDEMRGFFEERGATFGVLLLPDEYQFDPQLRAEAHRRAGRDDEGLVPRLVQERLGAGLAERGIAVLDPFDAFAAEHRPGTLFTSFDTHYDEAGNALVARLLADHVAAQRERR